VVHFGSACLDYKFALTFNWPTAFTHFSYPAFAVLLVCIFNIPSVVQWLPFLQWGAGICEVCQLSFCVVGSSGVLRKHGWGQGRQTCTGSGLIPLAQVVSPETSPPSFTTDAHTIPPRPPINSLFDFPVVQGVILKRIPKACRLLFERCLRDVIDAPCRAQFMVSSIGFCLLPLSSFLWGPTT